MGFANGTSATFGCDAENRVTSFYHAYSGGGHFVDRVIARNAVGDKQQENVNGGLSPKPTTQVVKQQSFDNADRLTTGTINGQSTTFSFDANGDLGSVAGPSPNWR